MVAQRRPQLANAQPRHDFGDGDVGPDRTQELGAGDEATGPLRQVAEHREGLGAQTDLALTVPQPLRGEVQPKRRGGLDRHDASPDAVIEPGYVLLRAERDRKGNGRVYRVRFTATNAFGGSCSGVVIVEAPVKPRTPSIDDGASFDSLIP